MIRSWLRDRAVKKALAKVAKESERFSRELTVQLQRAASKCYQEPGNTVRFKAGGYEFCMFVVPLEPTEH